MSTTTYAVQTVAGTTITYLPLTTPGPVLTPECASAFYLNPQDSKSIGAFDPWYGQHVNTTMATCLASEQTTWWDQADLASKTQYNLGPINCPNGYTMGTAMTINTQSTVFACCPSGYGYQNTIFNAGTNSMCISTVSSGSVITPMSFSGTAWVPTTITAGTAGLTIHGAQINGWNIHAVAATTTTPKTTLTATMVGGSTTSSASSSTTSTTTSTSSTLSTTTSSNLVQGGPSSTTSSSSQSISPTAIASNTDLSSGAKVGLGIGISLSIIGIACLLTTLWLLRKKLFGERQQGLPDYQQYYGQKEPGSMGAGGYPEVPQRTWQEGGRQQRQSQGPRRFFQGRTAELGV